MSKGRKKLVIVESPAKVKSIKKFLGKDYIVKASMGHVRDLPENRFGVDIENGFKPQYVILPSKRKVVVELKKAAKDVEEIYLAPDPDREGEAIAWHIGEILEDSKRIKRVTFNEITRDAVLKAFKHPTEIDQNRVNSQQARRILDRILGYKLSPLLWKKVTQGLSAGRVQSVALRLICERDEEIKNFKPEEYWTIEATFSSVNDVNKRCRAFLEKLENKKPKIPSKEKVDEIIEILKKESFKVDSIEEKEKKRKPYPPFNTSLMQQSAINKLGFSAAKTMQIAQQLYEGIELGEEGSVGLITYMRTDSFRVAKEAQEAARRYIKEHFGEEYLPGSPPKYKSKKAAQEAHEAIRPTYLEKTPENIKEYLTEDQYKLYKLIWERFLASQMENAIISTKTLRITSQRSTFKVSKSEVRFPGFLILYKEDGKETESTAIPDLVVGEEMKAEEFHPEQHFTKPPPPYTEATLVKTLEELGIGRPSTYAPTIATILKRGYVKKEKGKLYPTEMGKAVNDLLVERFPDIINVDFTAQMEEELDQVEQGKYEWVQVLKDFYKPFEEDLRKAQAEIKKMVVKVTGPDSKCPKCGRDLVIRRSRFGEFIACSGFPQCMYKRASTSGVRCPAEGCNGYLVRRYSKDGKRFYGCTNYPKCTFTVRSLARLKQISKQK